jgi:hypothetical protein
MKKNRRVRLLSLGFLFEKEVGEEREQGERRRSIGCEKGRREDLTIEKSHILVYNINEQNGYQDRVIKL